MTRLRRSLLAALAVLVTLLGGPAGPARAADVHRRTVLALFSDDRLLAINLVIDTAMRGVVEGLDGGESSPERSVDYLTEFIDMSRFPREGDEAAAIDFLRTRYQGVRVDVLILVGPASSRLVDKHRLFPGVPAVVCNTPQGTVDLRSPGRPLTGVLVDGPARFRATVELALRLQPDTRRIVYVGGVAPIDRLVEGVARPVLDGYAGRLTITYLTNLAFADLARELGRLTPGAVVVAGSVRRDAAGRFFIPRDALRALARITPVPIYGVFDSAFGHGLLAGGVGSTEETGGLAARMALRILEGEDAAHIPPVIEPVTPTVDARLLERFHIDRGLVPREAVVLFEEPSAWERYRGQMTFVVVLGVLETGLVVALLAQLRYRRRAERERREMEAALRQGRAEVARAARLTAMGELTATVAHELSQPLGAILTNAEAAQLLLARDELPRETIREIVDDICSDVRRGVEVIRSLRTLLKRRPISLYPMDLGAAVREALQLVEADAALRRVVLAVDLSSELPRVLGDRVLLVQVLLNLILNAMDAMSGEGRRERRIVVHAAEAEGCVEVSVSDRGTGIPADTLPRIFEPFFSTKAEGMGMGLSICRTIVQAHGGTITATNDRDRAEGPPGGATVRFTVPLAGEP